MGKFLLTGPLASLERVLQMLIAVILTLISGWSYLKDTPRILSIQSERDQRL